MLRLTAAELHAAKSRSMDTWESASQVQQMNNNKALSESTTREYVNENTTSAKQRELEGMSSQRSQAASSAAGNTEHSRTEASGRSESSEKPRSASAGSTSKEEEDPLQNIVVSIYLSKEQRVETVPLETYVQGVIAAEMPIDFELEALKAQAIAARTYIIRRLSLNDRSGMDGQKGDVTDTVTHQAYLSQDKLKSRWKGKQRKDNLAKLKQASEETKGLVILFDGEPIQAAFFSTSNGFTENSEDYWQQELPYLRSVTSPWDEELSPRYEEQQKLSLKQFYEKLDLSGKSAKGKPSIKVLERTEGNRIKSIEINGAVFTGRDIRERLSLASSQFTWKIKQSEITITTYGYGHGVGMSQWGANGMAKEGALAADILEHYYSGVGVSQASKLPSKT